MRSQSDAIKHTSGEKGAKNAPFPTTYNCMDASSLYVPPLKVSRLRIKNLHPYPYAICWAGPRNTRSAGLKAAERSGAAPNRKAHKLSVACNGSLPKKRGGRLAARVSVRPKGEPPRGGGEAIPGGRCIPTRPVSPASDARLTLNKVAR